VRGEVGNCEVCEGRVGKDILMYNDHMADNEEIIDEEMALWESVGIWDLLNFDR